MSIACRDRFGSQAGTAAYEPAKADRQPDRQVEVRVILQLEVQVGLGGMPGVAAAGDRLAAADLVAGLDQAAALFEVRQQAVLTLGVADHHVIAA